MASSKSGQRRAQGGGRTPNSEPKVQVFKEFNGINFQQSARDSAGFVVSQQQLDDADQTDLQMNYVYLQNNVAVTANKTFEVRDDIITMATPPEGVKLTGPVCLIGSKLFVALNDNNIACAGMNRIDHNPYPMTLDQNVTLRDNSGSDSHIWTSLMHADDKLIAQTTAHEMWSGRYSEYEVDGIDGYFENAKEVPDPTTDFTGHLTGMGTLVVSMTATAQCPFRTTIAHTYTNLYGPTKISPNTVFYTNTPVSEWHAGCYLRIDGTIPSGYAINAVELYYSADNAMEMLFFGRVDVDPNDSTWTYDWLGYVDATSMWPTANLVTPTENYTSGVTATRATSIDGRLYFWGASGAPDRLYIGGNPGNMLSISPGIGGGFVDVEPGMSNKIRYVCKYKTQSGNSIVTMLCDSDNSGKELRYNLVENSISLSNEQSMKSWQAEQVAGSVGCKSFDGALVCADGIYSVSRYGLALTTMTMEYNSQIRTNYVSDAIKPVFTDANEIEDMMKDAVLLEIDGIIYMAFGNQGPEGLDNVLFCYDIDLKAWWTYTLYLGPDSSNTILNIFRVDYEMAREGIGIVTSDGIYLLPTTVGDDLSHVPTHSFLIQTGKLSTQMPQQGWQYLSQLEFHFDYLIGNVRIEVRMTDMFGRDLKVEKTIDADELAYDYVARMRIDQRVMSYTITMTGVARFRLTHWLARVYTLSNKVGQVWGFDDSISHRSSGSVHPTFKSYNDVRDAIFT